MMIPFGQVELYNVYNDLKGHNNDLKVEIEDEIVHFNSILLSHDRLFVENPKQKHEENGIEQGNIIVGVALEFA